MLFSFIIQNDMLLLKPHTKWVKAWYCCLQQNSKMIVAYNGANCRTNTSTPPCWSCRSKEAGVQSMIISTSVSRYVTNASHNCVDANVSHSCWRIHLICYIHQQTDISSHAVNTCDICHNHQHLSITLCYQSKLQLYRCRYLTQLMKNTRHVTYISRLTLAVMLSIPVMCVPHYKLLTFNKHPSSLLNQTSNATNY